VSLHESKASGLRAVSLAVATSALALVVAGACTPAAAQEPYWLDVITILATKTEERAIDSLAAVSTVRQEQIRELMPNRTSDLLFGVPGVTFQERPDDTATAINIRGLQDFGRVVVTIDGARQNHQRTGHNADGMFYLDSELIGDADIVRGPVANIYGSGAIGGVVSFRTKDVEDVLLPGQKAGVMINGRAGFGAQPQGLGSIFGAVRAGENAEFIAGGVYRHKDSYEDGNGKNWPNTWSDVASGLAKATFRPADGHDVKFSGITQEHQFTSGQPTSASAAIYDTTARNHVANARWRYAKPEDKLRDFDGSVYWTRTEVEQRGVGGSVLGQQRAFELDTIGADLHNTTRAEVNDVRYALTYGVDAFRDKVNTTDPAGTGDLFTPSGQRTVLGGFAQLRTRYSTWFEMIGALRYDNYQFEGGGLSSDGSRLSPKITVGVTPVKGVTPYVTYAEGYRAPALTETVIAGDHPAPASFTFLPNPGLRPEVGKNKEAGVNLEFDNVLRQGATFRGKANWFRNDIDDFIELTLVPYTGPFGPCQNMTVFFCFQYQNVEKARIEGFEFETMYDAGAWFAGVSGHHLRGRNVTASIPLLKIPADQITTVFGLRSVDRKWSFALRWAAVAAKKASDIPNSPAITGNPDLPATGSYNLVNLYLGYAPDANTLLSFSVDNLLDEQYARYLDVYPVSGVGSLPFPSPGRTFKVAYQRRFAN
jgi:hemoglobin/transferrin/lactoferrin receptor protein